MKEVMVRDIYTVDTISKDNYKAWQVLMEVAKEEDVDTLFNFKGIEVIEPWGNNEFKNFIRNEHVYMKLYSSKKTADTIDMACVLGGMKSGRCFNEEVKVEVQMTPEERTILQEANALQSYFVASGDSAVLEIAKKITQIGSVSTVSYMEKAIELFCERTGIKNIIIDTDNIFIQKNIIKLISNVMGRALSKGIRIDVASKDIDVNKKLGIYRNLPASKSLTVQDRYKIIKDFIPKKMVGMLTKYKKTRTDDEFGRQGNGEPVSCRAAIFEGLVKNSEGVICMKFTSFNGKYFYTKEHWQLDNDGQTLNRLETQKLVIPLTDIGITDRFLGRRYHFTLPIQFNKEDYTELFSLDDKGSVVHTKATIPMRIKIVLDDWGVEYNESSLVHAIAETERILNKVEESQSK